MKFHRRFYDSSIDLKNLTTERLVLGIALGLASAFTICGFFYVIRESFRVLSFGFENIPDIISESNRDFFNIFFAGLSLIFGNSIAINFILSKPQNVLSYRNPKRRRILNDQIFLSFNFSYWFVKIGMLFGMFSICCMDFDFLPYFKIPSYLLLSVLYLESWKSLSTVFRRNRFKFQFFHLIVMIFLIFIFSRLDFINYKAVDVLSLKKNPIVDLPYSDFYNSENERRNFTIGYKLLLDNKGSLIIINENLRRISIEELANNIILEKNSRREELMPYISVILSADKNIKMRDIIKFQNELCKVNQRNLIYAIKNNDLISQRFEAKGISFRSCTPYFLNGKLTTNLIIPDNEIIPLPELPFETFYNSKEKLKVEIGEVVKINDMIVPKKMLVNAFKNHINKHTIFEYEFTLDTKYQDYISVLASHFKAANHLRIKEQTIFDKYENYGAFRKEQEILQMKYPIMKAERIN